VEPPKKEKKLEPARPKQVFSIRAPKDAEDGVQILDDLLEECRKIMGRDDFKGWKYFVLAEALYLVVQHGEHLVDA
jgi:hypothetical protein